jgi:hypothetical protein
MLKLLGVGLALGTLAAVFRPEPLRAAFDPPDPRVAAQLETLRQQIDAYRAQHNGAAPDLIGQQWAPMTLRTDVGGSTTAALRPYGPYLQETPHNPLNGHSAVAGAPGERVGYVYDPVRARLWATGKDPMKYYDETRAREHADPPQP